MPIDKMISYLSNNNLDIMEMSFSVAREMTLFLKQFG
jgi:hypothetical protein